MRKLSLLLVSLLLLSILAQTPVLGAGAQNQLRKPENGQNYNWSAGINPEHTAINVGATKTPAISESSVDLSTGLVAYYSFDHCDARDDSGNGHDGTIYGSPECVDGVKGKALYLNWGDYIKTVDKIKWSSNSFTIAGWLKPDSVDSWVAFVSKGGDYDICSSANSFNLEFYNGKGHVRFGETCWCCKYYTPEPMIQPNQFRFVVVTYDGNTLSFYVNGKKISETQVKATINSETSPIYIGADFPGGANYYQGTIDEVRIYNRALTDFEVQELYQDVVGRGYLNVTSTPSGAEVYIDGSYAGRTPLPEYPLSPGYHVVGVAYPGLPTCSTLVTITNGTTSAVSPNLTALLKESGLKWVWSSGAPVTTASTDSSGNLTVLGSGNVVVAINGQGIPIWFRRLDDPVSRVSVDGSGDLIVAGTLYDDMVYAFGADGSLLWKEAVAGDVNALAVSRDGKYVAVGTAGSLLYLFDGNGKQLWVYPSGSGVQSGKNVISVAISANDQYVAAGRKDGTLWLLKVDGTPVITDQLGGAVNSVAVTDDGRYLIAGSNDDNLYLYTTSGVLRWVRELSDDVYRVSTSGGRIAAGTWDGNVYLFGTLGNLLWKKGVSGAVTALAMDSSGGYVVAGTGFGKVVLFNASSGETIWIQGTGDRVWKVEAVPETGELLVASNGLRYFNALSAIECREEAEKAIGSAGEVIDNATEHGINVTDAQRLLNLAEGELSSGNCTGARELAELAGQNATRAISLAKESAEKAIEEAKNETYKARDMGLNVTGPLSLLNESESLFSGGYYPAAEDKAKEAYGIAQTLILRAEAEGEIERANDTVSFASSHGINVAEAQSLLSRAEQEFDSGNYTRAKEEAEKALSEAQAALDKAKRDAGAKIKLAEREISEARNLGADVADPLNLLNSALDLFNQSYYPAAAEKAVKAYDEAERLILRKKAEESIDEAREAIENATGEGADVNEARNLLNLAEEEFSSGNYTGAWKLANRSYSSALVGFSEAVVQGALSAGYNVSDAEDLVNEAREAYESGNYRDAVRAAEAALERVRDSVESMREMAWAEMGTANATLKKAEDDLDFAKEHGADSNALAEWENEVEGAKNTLAAAIRAYKDGDYIKAYGLARNSTGTLEKVAAAIENAMREKYREEALSAIQDAKEGLKNATAAVALLNELNVSPQNLPSMIASANRSLSEAEAAFNAGNYTLAIEGARESMGTSGRVVEKANELAENEANSRVSDAENCIKAAEKRGAVVAEAAKKLGFAKAALSEGDYLTAIVEAMKAESLCERAVRLFEDFSKAFEDATAYLSSLGSKGIGCQKGESLLREAKDSGAAGDYGKAIDLAKSALQAGKDCEQTGSDLLRKVEAVNSTANSLRGKGYYTGNVGLLLSRAAENVRNGNFTAAATYIATANSTLLRLKKEGDEALGKINEAEKAIKDAESLGLSPDKAEELLQKAKAAMARGDYKAAMSLAEEAVGRANDVDNDGIPNASDPFPTINNYYLYGAIALLLLLAVLLLRRYLRRRKLNRLYSEIVGVFKEVQSGPVPAEAGDEVKRMKELVNEAGDAYRRGDMKGLEGILGEIRSTGERVSSKRREYESLKREIIEEINSILGVQGGQGSEG